MYPDKNQRKSVIDSEDRLNIQEWRKKRTKKMAARKSYFLFYLSTFSLETLHSFAQNINLMVIIQMVIAGVSVYIFQLYGISFELHVTLFVSPIVFPLAFSINTDFQRREKVLEDLAQFKSSGMVWYFCMRDWKQAAQLDNDWIGSVHAKLRSLLFHLREYLLTYKIERRKVILRAIYEDFSDTNQLIERLRASKLPSNAAIISRSIHLLSMMCLSFERLRVIREYRSPRSIRSFNKVLIMFLPIILSPYFVHLGKKSDNKWEPYFISTLVAFVFSALQGVQDKLDDPFDGMSEDDIHLDTFDDEWNSSLERTMKRSFPVGLFKRVRSSFDEREGLLSKRLFGFRNSKDSGSLSDDGNSLEVGGGVLGSRWNRRKSTLDSTPSIGHSIEYNSMRCLDAILEPVTITDTVGNVASLPIKSCNLYPDRYHPAISKRSNSFAEVSTTNNEVMIEVRPPIEDKNNAPFILRPNDVTIDIEKLNDDKSVGQEQDLFEEHQVTVHSNEHRHKFVQRFCRLLRNTKNPIRYAYKNASFHFIPYNLSIFNGFSRKAFLTGDSNYNNNNKDNNESNNFLPNV